MKRKHQVETENEIDGIIEGSGKKHIILMATPGAGKSSVPQIGGKLVTAGLAEGICWCVPRGELQSQGERGFLDPFFRHMFNHKLSIRSSTNEWNPCRDTNGFITTYQALGVDTQRITAQEFARRRYVLVLDEYHHVEKGGMWHKAIQPLYEKAAYTILMTGTLERSNGKPIAYTPYDGLMPNLQGTDDTAVIRYTRQDALREQAILPIKFFLSDGQFQWKTEGGHLRDAKSFKNVFRKKDQSDALYTALNTQFAEQLLYDCVQHWKIHKKTRNPRAKLLVVAADYGSAKRYTALLKTMGVYASIATSHKPKEATAAIRAFKSNSLNALVTIAMAYEGMDVPAITHIAALTHIRSTPWIEQMVARAVRIDREAGPYESQIAYVFAPEDAAFREVVGRIEHEQVAALKPSDPYGSFRDDKKKKKAPDGQGGLATITPLSSNLTGKRELQLGIAPVQMGLFGDDPPREKRSIPVEPVSIPEPKVEKPIETPKEKEIRLRRWIKEHVNAYAFNNRYKPEQINSELKIKMGNKPRNLLTVTELEFLWNHLKDNYPLALGSTRPRMDGVSPARAKRKRVPTRAVPWNGY